MALLIFFVLLALAVSFLCSILEAILLSISPSYIAAESKKGRRAAKLWQHYKADIDRPLAAILSLNTIAHTVGAVGAGAQATRVFGEASYGIVSAVLTLLILVLSEIVPKTLGAIYWRQMSSGAVYLLRAVMWLMHPLVLLAQALTRLLQRGSPQHSISREEFAALAEIGVKEGVFSQGEAEVVRSMMRFRSLAARDVMTPRPVLFALPQTATVADVVKDFESIRFSRIPIYDGEIDNITGFIRKDDLLLAAARHSAETQLSSLRRELLTVPESLSVATLLRRMTESWHQIALAVNEYGDVRGLVTMEDLVETLLGVEIVDETDSHKDMQVLARDLWRRRARELGVDLDESGEPSQDRPDDSK